MQSRRGWTVVAVGTAIVLIACGQPAAISSQPGRENPRSGAAVALDQTSATALDPTDLENAHGPGDANGNRAPVFGALPIASASPDLPPGLGAFLGRWEGFGYAPPIKRDWKFVLAVTDISATTGTAYAWAGTNLQFPALVERVQFRVRGTGSETAIEWEQTIDGGYAIVRIRRASGTEALEGSLEVADPSAQIGPILLRRDSADHVVHRDYVAHLASFGIEWRAHEADGLKAFGAGSLVHLPAGYDADPDRTWPLILFLHGSGDRGDNGLVIAQNSPFRYVTGGTPLDAIVVAPLLAAGQPTFPTAYLDAVVDNALATYRVDRDRVTLTGLSMGGEAAYRLGRHRPETFAGVAVLCGFDAAHFPVSIGWGYEPIVDPPERLRDVAVRVIHGRNDMVVPIGAAQATVSELARAGVDVEYSILDHYGHDVWTETFSDPDFFAWLLAQRRPAG